MQVQLLWANNPWENTNSLKTNSGPKLYSKVLTIEPNRLLIKYSLLDKGAGLHLCSAIVLECHSTTYINIKNTGA
jgi:hypothetical protein